MVDRAYRILLVDDEDDILHFLSYNLKKEGYEVLTSSNGKEAIAIALKHVPDLIILDVMMPELDGIQTSILMRKEESLDDSIIVFLSARTDVNTQFAGLDSGAVDFFTKPIAPRILISRIKVLLSNKRRLNGLFKNNVLNLGAIRIDFENLFLFKGEEEIFLTKKEFALLGLLTSNPNKVFKKEAIVEQIWGADSVVGSKTVDIHIQKIIEKLAIDNIKVLNDGTFKFEF
jgi:two-component system, OmpR family, alkaline phosphatase synthesis response regulator PhoP